MNLQILTWKSSERLDFPQSVHFFLSFRLFLPSVLFPLIHCSKLDEMNIKKPILKGLSL